MDWLTIWGVTQAAGFAFKPILQDLVVDSAKDYTKDFFKNCIGKAIRLPEKNALKEAYGKALKEFLELVQQELKLAGFSKQQIQQEYTEPLKIFLMCEIVASILGDAFLLERKSLNITKLVETWSLLQLHSLPSSFNWDRISTLYIDQVHEIIQESDKLRPIFLAKAEMIMAEELSEILGISVNLDLTSYAEGLKEQYGYLRLESIDPTSYERLRLWRMFVPQNVRECRQFMPQIYEIPKEHLQKLRERGEVELAELVEEELENRRREYFRQPLYPIIQIVQSEKSKKTVILGDPGSGKSTLLQYIALDWAEKSIYELSVCPLPLLIELRTYARDKELGRCNNFLKFFHDGNLVCHLNQKLLHEKLQDGNVIALFDGLDEVFDPHLRDEVITDIHRFSNLYPDVQIIVTSRWLGYKAEKLMNAEFQHFMLEELNDIQIQDFVQRWHDLAFSEGIDRTRKQERLQKAIIESQAIRELAGNPLLLTMMAILNRNQDLPRDRSRLYERATEILLHQWDVETKILEDLKLKKIPVSIDYQDKQAMLRKVAYHMQANESGLTGNLISSTDLKDILVLYLKTIEVVQSREVADLMIQQLRIRNFILCLLGGNSFAFVHRTFLEYFCAREFCERFKQRGLKGGLTIEELKTEGFGKHWKDKSWHEVLRLIVGMLSSEFPKEISKSIIDFLIEQDGYQSKFTNVFLAIDCFSELRNRNIFSETSTELVNHLESLFEITSEWEWDDKLEIQKQMIFKVSAIWKDDIFAWNMLHSIALMEKFSYIADDIAISISTVAKSNLETLPLLKSLGKAGTDKAVEALSKNWKNDPETFIIICRLARKRHNIAIVSMIEDWRDNPETLKILQELAKKDKHKQALDALCKYFSYDHTSMAILENFLITKATKKNTWNRNTNIFLSESIECIIQMMYKDEDEGEDIYREEFKLKMAIDNIEIHQNEKNRIFEIILSQIRDFTDNSLAKERLSKIEERCLGHLVIQHKFSTLRTKITDAEILKASLRDLGIQVRTETDLRGYQGQRVRADIVAVLEGEYDLGWSRNSDGSFDLIADLWGVAKKHNQTELINSINQKYAVNKTLAEVGARGDNSSDLK